MLQGIDKYVFLGMGITFKGDGTFSVLMKEYLEESIDMFEELYGEILGTATTPANKGLFTVNPDSKILFLAKAKAFHSVTEKLLYISNMARLDLKLTINFYALESQKVPNMIGES